LRHSVEKVNKPPES